MHDNNKGDYKPETKLLTIKVKSVHFHTEPFNWTIVHYTKAIYSWTHAAATTIDSDYTNSLLVLSHF